MVAPGFELAVGFSLAFLAFAVAYPVRGLGYLGLGAGLILILVGFLGSFALGGLPLIAAEVVAPVVAVAVALAVSHSRRVRSETAAESLAAAGAEYSRRTNVLAILALVFGVIGGSVLAVVFGHVALGQIRRSGDAGRGLALAGLVLGYLGIGVIGGSVLAVVLVIPLYG
ncbi:DUF4190 domain-containing protein [Agromyces atrinae]|nr:DUF4190 domain-containing protein [Agromyces atrinae]